MHQRVFISGYNDGDDDDNVMMMTVMMMTVMMMTMMMVCVRAVR